MQTILIPTDFNIEALQCVDALCQTQDQELTLIFMHMVKLSDSITDLLMLSRRRRETETVSDIFFEKCCDLKRRNPGLSIRIEFFYGSTMNMFRNFLEANDVNAILNLDDCSISKLHASSADPVALINKSGLPIISVVKVPEQAVNTEVKSIRKEVLAEEAVY